MAVNMPQSPYIKKLFSVPPASHWFPYIKKLFSVPPASHWFPYIKKLFSVPPASHWFPYIKKLFSVPPASHWFPYIKKLFSVPPASHWFPYIKKRIPIIHQEQFEFSPIEVHTSLLGSLYISYGVCRWPLKPCRGRRVTWWPRFKGHLQT